MHAGMDTADWLKSIVQEECGGMDSSCCSPPGELISCTTTTPPPPPPHPAVMERRLRPQHDQPLKCPRCDSAHTKFCYYNNYSLSQPRYFCKTCRRYWTKGGSLRNVPVGGGCRKNKRPGGAVKKPPEQFPGFPPPHIGYPLAAAPSSSVRDGAADLHLSSFPALQLPYLGALAAAGQRGPLGLMECNHDPVFEGHDTLDGGELGAAFGNPRNLLFLGGSAGDHLRGIGGLGDLTHGFSSSASAFVDVVSPAGYAPPVEGGTHSSGAFANSCHRLGLPLLEEGRQGAEQYCSADMKPAGGKLLSLEWQDPAGCNDVGRDGFGYPGGLGLWAAGMMGGHGASTSNTMI